MATPEFQKDTATDFAVHPPKQLFPIRILEPLEDQIHPDDEKVLVFRPSIKEVKEWEADILEKYGWRKITGDEPWLQ